MSYGANGWSASGSWATGDMVAYIDEILPLLFSYCYRQFQDLYGMSLLVSGSTLWLQQEYLQMLIADFAAGVPADVYRRFCMCAG